MFKFAAADDAGLAHLPADQGRVRAGAAEGRENALGDLHAAQVFRAGFAADEDQLDVRCPSATAASASAAWKHDLAGGRAGTGVDALGQQLARRRSPPSSASGSKIGCSSWFRSSAGMRLADSASSLRDQPFVDQVDGDAHGGEAGPLGVAGLQHPDLAALDRELDVLHVPVVLLELLADLDQLLVTPSGMSLAERLFDPLRRADAGDDVFALGVDQVVAVEARRAERARRGSGPRRSHSRRPGCRRPSPAR